MNDIELLNSIKNDMGLHGKGIGKRAYKKRQPMKGGKLEDVANMPFKIEGSAYGDLLNALEQKNQEFVGAGMNGEGFFSDMLSMVPIVGNIAGPLAKKVGLGKQQENGAGILSGLVSMVPIVGPVLSGAMDAKKKLGLGVSAGKRRGKGLSAGGLSAGNVPLLAAGLSAGGLSAGGKPKRKYVKKNGAGLLDVVSKVANISPFTNTLANNPLSQLMGQENVRQVAVNAVKKMLGGKKVKKAKGKKGNKKIAERAKIVKKIMKERGISMIEASKAVKSEGLY